ncbi:DHHW family protein [Anaerosacchariphilus polymeriproducens]|uniref:AlgX/AlgJ SGNH hydrolase-like domain-containing protein n=1 Tax=Anaerosacchariphilus polymeriproducens TaxID=1812858 RepID=A0A371ARG0_9FIRM|nr:DHHW family protein [Anaerosacchariphilus polymeriproducens]RDU22124.1 hypothetical protein DWV06_16475 [Anaerosacchariphilus polymeriproducens]
MEKMKENRLLMFFFLIIIIGVSFLNLKNVLSSFENVQGKTLEEKFQSFETTYNTNFAGQHTLINADGYMAKLIGRRSFNNRIKLNNGRLVEVYGKADISKQAENVVNLNRFLDDKEIPFLWIQTPCSINKYDKELPEGIEDHSNENADKLLNEFDKNRVNYLDLRENINKSNLDYDSLFFKTDHHWNIEGAFFAYTQIVEELNKNYGFKIDKEKTNINNFEKKIYKDWFLGSCGKRTGIYYAGIDDISLIYPKFETNMSLELPYSRVYREGTFEQAIFDMNRIKEKNYFGDIAYAVYTGSDYPLVIHKNNLVKDNKKILIIKDSYVLPLESFLSTCVGQIDVIDLRHFTDKSVYDYVKETKPDIVLQVIQPPSVANMEHFQYN